MMNHIISGLPPTRRTLVTIHIDHSLFSLVLFVVLGCLNTYAILAGSKQTEVVHMTIQTSDTPYLVGHLLVAMPGMPDSRFDKAVIYVCAHSEEGAMGLVINQAMEDISLTELLEQLGVPSSRYVDEISVQLGGPVEQGRGFVLHTPEYVHDSTLVVDEKMALTGTLDILQDIALGDGPQKSLLILGYAGWGPGQLDAEILENGWLTVEADQELVFSNDLDTKWKDAMTKLGIDLSLLSEDAGHA